MIHDSPHEVPLERYQSMSKKWQRRRRIQMNHDSQLGAFDIEYRKRGDGTPFFAMSRRGYVDARNYYIQLWRKQDTLIPEQQVPHGASEAGASAADSGRALIGATEAGRKSSDVFPTRGGAKRESP
jgi:hypothetical protein